MFLKEIRQIYAYFTHAGIKVWVFWSYGWMEPPNLVESEKDVIKRHFECDDVDSLS